MLTDLGRVACPCVHSLNLWQSRALGWKDNWYSLPSSPPSEVSFHAMMWRVGKGGSHGLLDMQLIHWDHRETWGRKAPYQEMLSKQAQWKFVFFVFFLQLRPSSEKDSPIRTVYFPNSLLPSHFVYNSCFFVETYASCLVMFFKFYSLNSTFTQNITHKISPDIPVYLQGHLEDQMFSHIFNLKLPSHLSGMHFPL